MKKELICIVCPSSCHLMVEEVNGEIMVKGNACNRGYDHGIKEFSAPERILTTTVVIENADLQRIPVISNGEIPKDKMMECLALLYQTKVVAPIKCGDIMLKNIGGTGVDICASRSIQEKEKN